MVEGGILFTRALEAPEEDAAKHSWNFAANKFVTTNKKPSSMGIDLGAMIAISVRRKHFYDI